MGERIFSTKECIETWGMVEIMGHRHHWGRISEVERFGTKMCRIEVPTEDTAVFEAFDYGGSAIFSVKECSEEKARAMARGERRPPIEYFIERYLRPPEMESTHPANDEFAEVEETPPASEDPIFGPPPVEPPAPAPSAPIAEGSGGQDNHVGFSREWCVAAAKREGDAEVGAGPVARDPQPEDDEMPF